MTAQDPDILINEHSIELGWLQPYFVSGVQDDDNDYSCFPVPPSFPNPNPFCTSLWRGYVATLRLCSDGCLELVQYDFPHATNDTPPQIVNKYFTGDFHLTLRPFFQGPNTHVPFRHGIVVDDRDQWIIDDQVLFGVVSSVLRNRETGRAFGLLVDIGFKAFLPAALVPLELRLDLNSLVGRKLECVIKDIHGKRRDVILEPLRFGDVL